MNELLYFVVVGEMMMMMMKYILEPLCDDVD